MLYWKAGRDSNSVVLQLSYGHVEAEGEARLVEAGAPLKRIVLKAADGGDRDGTTQAFVEDINPWVVIFSAGERNPRRHLFLSTENRATQSPSGLGPALGDVKPCRRGPQGFSNHSMARFDFMNSSVCLTISPDLS